MRATAVRELAEIFTKARLEAGLAKTEGRISEATGAAAIPSTPHSTIESKIKTLKIDKRRFANL